MKKNIKQFLKAFVLFMVVYFIVKIGVSSLIKFSSDGFHSEKVHKTESVKADKLNMSMLEERALSSDVEAMYKLSVMNLNLPLADTLSFHLPLEMQQKAFYWANKAYENGSIEAITRLACLYEYGVGVERDLDKALELYIKAVEAGNLEAKVRLAMFYAPSPNNKVRQKYANKEKLTNEAKAKALIADFLDAVDARDDLDIGFYSYAIKSYLEGELCEKDVSKAVSIIEKVYQQNLPKTKFDSELKGITQALVFCYIKGIGVEKDEAKALEIYNKMQEVYVSSPSNFLAYELGLLKVSSAKEYENLGRDYYFSSINYTFKDLYESNKGKAKELYEKAAEMDYHLAYCRLAMDVYYKNDTQKAFELLNKSLEGVGEVPQGDEVNLLLYLARAYKDGTGTEKNITKAIELLEQASLAKNSGAYDLGFIYFEGKDLGQDYKKALAYFLDAEKGIKSAKLYSAIAKCYEEQGDISLSLDYYKKALNENEKIALNKSPNKERLEAKIKELESELNKKEDL